MTKNIDLLLINSFAPRQRIASDAALENGLAMIRTYLEDRGFSVYVADEQRVSLVERGVPQWCTRLLRTLVKFQLAYNGRFKILALLALLLAWPVQSLTLRFRKYHMDKIIDNIATLVKTEKIPLVGIKVWGGAPYAWSVKLAKKIREVNPETTLIAGGPHVKVYGEYVLAQGEFDLAIMGPGEEMLEHLLNKRITVPTKEAFLELVHREIGPSPLIRTGHYHEQSDYMFHSFTIPKYRAVDMADKVWFHTLIDGLGCTWNKCSFCTHTRQNTYYTPRPVEEIRNEIMAMTSRGIAFFRFSSSETPLGHGRAIAQMILGENLKINYSMFARPGKTSEQVYKSYRLMIRSGLRAVFLGGETGHDEINDKIMNKGVVRKDIIDTIQCIKLAAVAEGLSCQVVLSMIYPCPVIPGVSLEDVFEQNVTLIKEANPDAVIINPPGVFPGTVWFEQREKLGFKLGNSFVNELMNYEYSIYKPVEFWQNLDYTLDDLDLRKILKEIGRLNKAIVDMGVPINISDDYLMMSQAIGYSSKADLFEFKRISFVDIISGTCNYIKQITKTMNERSKLLAASNPPTQDAPAATSTKERTQW
ncbi:B12-binding domain-containing radical SAM protein [Sporomusa sp.]|uniref:B12-binding domain-containing radical SAM protein n=1 Tax=Sporomusa sp. TaxID=2078658 RepID=UPI002BC028C0|nr:cobalamin-dependent protein [Sporomusa sp.]HWR44215.1 cobalamin-dependent protein [Sporomusa sp.]